MKHYLIWFPANYHNSYDSYHLRVQANSLKQALSKLIFSPRAKRRKYYLYFDYNGRIYSDTPKYSKFYDPEYSLEHLFNLVWKNKDFQYVELDNIENPSNIPMAKRILNKIENSEYIEDVEN